MSSARVRKQDFLFIIAQQHTSDALVPSFSLVPPSPSSSFEMANVGLFKVLLSSTIAIIILVCVYVRKFHSTPSPRKRVVLGDDHALEPPHEVKGPLPDDGSDTASLSTLQTLTPPMKIYVCSFFFFVSLLGSCVLIFCRVHRDRKILVPRPYIQSTKKPRVRVHRMALTSGLSQHTS